jgi:hypothetical protein
VQTLFGFKPLVISSVPIEREREPYWSWYPGALESEVGYLTAGRTREKWYEGGYFAGASERGVQV